MTDQLLRFESPDPLGRAQSRRARAPIKAQGIVQRGEHLVHAGERIDSPYLIVAGVLKSYLGDENGKECVVGFHMPGDVVGFEALLGRKAFCGVLALETAEVLPLRSPSSLGPDLMTEMCREILRLVHLLQMDRCSTDSRVARFLLNYSELQEQRGCSPYNLVLPMARYDLARYLGLATETVSRVLSRFRDLGWLTVDKNHITIQDAASLLRAAGDTGSGESPGLQ